MKIELALIRHAPTADSNAGVFMGWRDVPLTEEDLMQLEEPAKKLANTRIDYCFSSPLQRALQSAKALFPEAQIMVEDTLIERGLGNWSGQRKSELRKSYPNAFLASGHIDPYFCPEDGEPIEQVVERAEKFLNKVALLGGEGSSCENRDPLRVVAVTHNGFIRTLRCLVEECPLSEIFLVNEPYLVPRVYRFDGQSWHLLPSEVNGY